MGCGASKNVVAVVEPDEDKKSRRQKQKTKTNAVQVEGETSADTSLSPKSGETHKSIESSRLAIKSKSSQEIKKNSTASFKPSSTNLRASSRSLGQTQLTPKGEVPSAFNSNSEDSNSSEAKTSTARPATGQEFLSSLVIEAKNSHTSTNSLMPAKPTTTNSQIISGKQSTVKLVAADNKAELLQQAVRTDAKKSNASLASQKRQEENIKRASRQSLVASRDSLSKKSGSKTILKSAPLDSNDAVKKSTASIKVVQTGSTQSTKALAKSEASAHSLKDAKGSSAKLAKSGSQGSFAHVKSSFEERPPSRHSIYHEHCTKSSHESLPRQGSHSSLPRTGSQSSLPRQGSQTDLKASARSLKQEVPVVAYPAPEPLASPAIFHVPTEEPASPVQQSNHSLKQSKQSIAQKSVPYESVHASKQSIPFQKAKSQSVPLASESIISVKQDATTSKQSSQDVAANFAENVVDKVLSEATASVTGKELESEVSQHKLESAKPAVLKSNTSVAKTASQKQLSQSKSSLKQSKHSIRFQEPAPSNQQNDDEQHAHTPENVASEIVDTSKHSLKQSDAKLSQSKQSLKQSKQSLRMQELEENFLPKKSKSTNLSKQSVRQVSDSNAPISAIIRPSSKRSLNALNEKKTKHPSSQTDLLVFRADVSAAASSTKLSSKSTSAQMLSDKPKLEKTNVIGKNNTLTLGTTSEPDLKKSQLVFNGDLQEGEGSFEDPGLFSNCAVYDSQGSFNGDDKLTRMFSGPIGPMDFGSGPVYDQNFNASIGSNPAVQVTSIGSLPRSSEPIAIHIASSDSNISSGQQAEKSSGNQLNNVKHGSIKNLTPKNDHMLLKTAVMSEPNLSKSQLVFQNEATSGTQSTQSAKDEQPQPMEPNMFFSSPSLGQDNQEYKLPAVPVSSITSFDTSHMPTVPVNSVTSFDYDMPSVPVNSITSLTYEYPGPPVNSVTSFDYDYASSRSGAVNSLSGNNSDVA